MLLILLDQHVEGFAKVRGHLEMVVAPVHYLVDAPFQLFDQGKVNFSNQQALIEVNTTLKAKQILLEARIHELISLLHERRDFQKLTAKLPQNQANFLLARLLAVDLQPAKQHMLINQGKKAGVYVGQAVVDGDGVVGQVVSVNAFSSRVLLLSDIHSAIPVQISRNGLRAVVIGMGSLDKLALINLVDTADVKPGDLLVSSGLGGHYPAGYPVGEVTHIKHIGGERFATIDVKPAAHLQKGRQVLLVGKAHE